MSKRIPPDPEMMNDDRADWANVAILAFQHKTNTDDDDALADLLADLMHWSDRDGYNFERELARAQQMYREETTEL